MFSAKGKIDASRKTGGGGPINLTVAEGAILDSMDGSATINGIATFVEAGIWGERLTVFFINLL
jgi:hypothetical protein